MNKEEIENYKKEYDNMSLCDLADELVEHLLTVKKELAKTIYIHYAEERDKNYKLQQQNKQYKEVIDKAIKCIYYSTKYRNSADIYQFVDIESEILEPLKFILELNEENGNAYLKEFNDWLKEVE